MLDNPIPNAIPFRTAPRTAGAAGLLAALVGIGVLAVLLGAGADVARMWQAMLFNWLFWSSVAIGMVMFAVALHITAGEWAWSVRRAALGGAAFLPISFVLLIVILLFGNEHFFSHWLHAAGDPVIERKSAWLNLPGLITRDLLGVAVLFGLALAFMYFSVRPDVYGVNGERNRPIYGRLTSGWRGVPEEARRSHRILSRIAPVLGILYAVLWGMIAIDLAMSLEPHWFSTMFPVAFFMTAFHSGIAATIVAAIWLRKSASLEEFIGRAQFHDLGKLLFAFAVFWMYLNWSQYIVIWYGMLPHEQEWFIHRFSDPFSSITRAAVLMIFVIPFFGLLPRAPKLVPGVLVGFALLILAGHWLERFLLVAPSLREESGFPIGLTEIGVGLGFAGLFLAAYLWYARTFPLLPSPATLAARNSPVVAEPVGATHA